MTRARISASALTFIGLAVVLAVVGFVYFTTTSADLPSFLPGHFEASHAAGQVAQARKHHVKLGVASFALAICALAAAWYSAAPDRELGN